VNRTMPLYPYQVTLPTTLGLTDDEWHEIFVNTIKLGIAGAISGYITYKLTEKLNDVMFQEGKKQKEHETQSAKILQEHGLLTKTQTLTAHECRFVGSIIQKGLSYPFDAKENDSGIEGFESIGGLANEISRLKHAIITPLERKKSLQVKKVHNEETSQIDAELNAAMEFYKASTGVLLYGPPGTGKTALIRAISAELNIPFLHIQISEILDKWMGESNKLVNAIFSLANKISPCIIFIDEIDSLLGVRRRADHELSTQIKTQFMSLWDGLSKPENEVILVAATNRPHMLDPAVDRRFTMKIQLKQPSCEQLKSILQAKFRNADVSLISDVDWNKLAVLCFHFKMTGADIQETCHRITRLRIDNYVTNGDDKLEVINLNLLRGAIAEVGLQKTSFDESHSVYSEMFNKE